MVAQCARCMLTDSQGATGIRDCLIYHEAICGTNHMPPPAHTQRPLCERCRNEFAAVVRAYYFTVENTGAIIEEMPW